MPTLWKRYAVRIWRNGRCDFANAPKFELEDAARQYARTLYGSDLSVTCVEVFDSDPEMRVVIEVWRG